MGDWNCRRKPTRNNSDDDDDDSDDDDDGNYDNDDSDDDYDDSDDDEDNYSTYNYPSTPTNYSPNTKFIVLNVVKSLEKTIGAEPKQVVIISFH